MCNVPPGQLVFTQPREKNGPAPLFPPPNPSNRRRMELRDSGCLTRFGLQHRRHLPLLLDESNSFPVGVPMQVMKFESTASYPAGDSPFLKVWGACPFPFKGWCEARDKDNPTPQTTPTNNPPAPKNNRHNQLFHPPPPTPPQPPPPPPPPPPQSTCGSRRLVQRLIYTDPPRARVRCPPLPYYKASALPWVSPDHNIFHFFSLECLC